MAKGFGSRFYQRWGAAKDLRSFRVTVLETELLICSHSDLSHIAAPKIRQLREQIETYSQHHPEFQTSLQPLSVDAEAPAIVQTMASAAELAGVGPFAAVAGAIAEAVGRELLQYSADVIVENGGDVFVASSQERNLGIYAGTSPLSGKLALRLAPSQMPCGVCTSSGTVGHSLSFGKADAAIVLAPSTALADACATALGNLIRAPEQIAEGLRMVEQIEGVDGAVIIIGSQIGAWGQVQLVRTALPERSAIE